MRRSITLALVLALSGCTIVATHQEYAAYRAVRTARTQDERLVASAAFAQNYSGSALAPEVVPQFLAQEDTIWASGNATRDGLERYLALYPTGEYVVQARERLTAVSTVATHQAVEETHTQAATAQTRAQLAEQRRQWASVTSTFWLRTILGIRNFGQPIGAVARANLEFSAAFGQEPAPVCVPSHCLKHYHSHYAIPVPGATRIERDMDMFLRVRMGERGRVERIELLMPNKGFSRWYEMANRTLVTDEDPVQRQQAIEWALAQLAPILTESAAGSHSIDVIPEPIDPISASGSTASRVEADGETEMPREAPAATTAETPAVETPPPADDSLEALLAAAAGGTGETLPEVVEEDSSSATTAMTMVLPIGLRALQLRNVRLVIFAAGEEDDGDGYDGFYVEIARD